MPICDEYGLKFGFFAPNKLTVGHIVIELSGSPSVCSYVHRNLFVNRVRNIFAILFEEGVPNNSAGES